MKAFCLHLKIVFQRGDWIVSAEKYICTAGFVDIFWKKRYNKIIRTFSFSSFFPFVHLYTLMFTILGVKLKLFVAHSVVQEALSCIVTGFIQL